MPVEAIDIIFAHKDGERVCNRLHGNADLARFCPIDSDARFRAVEREVTVDKGKQTTAPGCAFDFLHLRVNRREIVRSEEHTSELQSLMRISYAVFCLKKKQK